MIMKTSDQCILVRGPSWGDALFYGEWLLAAAKAETFWKDALKDLDSTRLSRAFAAGLLPALADASM